MRSVKWIIAVIVFIIVSVVSYEIIPQYIGKVYYKKAMRSFYGVDGELKGKIWIPKYSRDIYRKGESDYKDAISKFEIAKKCGVENIQSMLFIASAYTELGQYEKAVEYGNEILKIDPHNNDAGRGLVDTLIELKKYDEAEQLALDRASYLSNNEDAYLEIAQINAIKKDFNKAKEYIDKCVELTDIKSKLNIDERVANKFMQSHITYDLGNYAEVVKILDEMHRLDPKNTGVYIGYAESYEKLGNKEKALENWKKVVDLNDPPNAVEQAKQKIKLLEAELKTN